MVVNTIKKTISGFTLIELLIVMGIMSVIVSFVVVTFPASQKKARDTQKKSDLRQYAITLEKYSNKTAGVYPLEPVAINLTVLCETKIFGEMTCPDNPDESDDYMYITNATGTEYAIWSELENESLDWAYCSGGLAGYLGKDKVPSATDLCPLD